MDTVCHEFQQISEKEFKSGPFSVDYSDSAVFVETDGEWTVSVCKDPSSHCFCGSDTALCSGTVLL